MMGWCKAADGIQLGIQRHLPLREARGPLQQRPLPRLHAAWLRRGPLLLPHRVKLHSLTASCLAACFLIIDIGVLILNRYILLDHILLLFIYFIYLSLQFHSINIPGLGVIVLAHVCMNMI